MLFDLGNTYNYIHTIEFFKRSEHQKKKKKLLMVHGFFSSGAFFFKHAYALREEFDVTVIDLLGMGLSGRPKFTLTRPKDFIDYFILSIEAWIKETGYTNNGEKYILAGHSIGGYVCANYALKNKEEI